MCSLTNGKAIQVTLAREIFSMSSPMQTLERHRVIRTGGGPAIPSVASFSGIGLLSVLGGALADLPIAPRLMGLCAATEAAKTRAIRATPAGLVASFRSIAEVDPFTSS